MADTAKTVFLSYRRARSEAWAVAISSHLQDAGYDVFMDVKNLDSGEFPKEILDQIESRAHFIALLSPGSFSSVLDSDDWLRREIECAIASERNVVPVLVDRFDFKAEYKKLGKNVPKQIKRLADFTGVPVPSGYFEEAMVRLTGRFLTAKAAASIEQPAKKSKSTARELRDLDWVHKKIKKIELDAPKLQEPARGLDSFKLIWSPVLLADKYVLEASRFQSMTGKTLYEGPNTEFKVNAPAGKSSSERLRWFRVKAVGASFTEPSAWSNHVALFPDSWGLMGGSAEAPALVLTYDSKWVQRLKWSPVAWAMEYIVEGSSTHLFLSAPEVYKGVATEVKVSEVQSKPALKKNTWWFDPANASHSYYRVKARLTLGRESPWSNTVDVGVSPFALFK